MEWGLPGGCSYLDLDLFNQKIYLSKSFNKGHMSIIDLYIFLFEVGLLQLPLSPQQKLNTLSTKASGVYHRSIPLENSLNLKLQQLGICPSAIH